MGQLNIEGLISFMSKHFKSMESEVENGDVPLKIVYLRSPRDPRKSRRTISVELQCEFLKSLCWQISFGIQYRSWKNFHQWERPTWLYKGSFRLKGSPQKEQLTTQAKIISAPSKFTAKQSESIPRKYSFSMIATVSFRRTFHIWMFLRWLFR